MSRYNELSDMEILNHFNEEHGKLRENLEDLSGQDSIERLQWASEVMRPAFGVYAEIKASLALSANERRELLPEITGARKLTDAIVALQENREQPTIWQLLKRWWQELKVWWGVRNHED